MSVYARELDMLDRFFLRENPALPLRVPVGHASKDEAGYLQTRVTEANCVDDVRWSAATWRINV